VKLFARPARNVILGHCYVDEPLDAANAEAGEGRHTAAVALLRECRDDPETRMLRLQVLGRTVAGHGDEVAKLAREQDDPELLLIAGEAYVEEAWAVRGSTANPRRFGATLQLALEPLTQVSRMLPDDAVVWAVLMTVARGLEFSREEQDAIWAETVNRAPFLYAAYRIRLRDSGDMTKFATDTVNEAPPGDPVTAMLPLALFERYAAEAYRTRPKNLWRLAGRMFRDATSHITAAADKWNSAPHPRQYEAHNLFAGAFAVIGDKDRAVHHLRAMADRVATWPWGFLEPEPAVAYQRVAARYGV
jgi:hypothetical protein